MGGNHRSCYAIRSYHRFAFAREECFVIVVDIWNYTANTCDSPEEMKGTALWMKHIRAVPTSVQGH